MPGLDPGIHPSKKMDCRVKPGNDEMKKSAPSAKAVLRDWQDTVAAPAPVQAQAGLPQ
jgi:hypothetical protein